MMQGIHSDNGLTTIDEDHAGELIIKWIVSNGSSDTPCNSLDGNRRSTYFEAGQQFLRFLAGLVYEVCH